MAMYLNSPHIEATFLRESMNDKGQREAVLVVKMDADPMALKHDNPRDYEDLSWSLSSLDKLAKNGFLDFHRVEVISQQTQ